VNVLRPLGVAAGAALAVQWSPATAVVLPAAARAFGIPTTVEGAGVLLTFDDGPHPEGTPAVLDELDRLGASAVFFVSGEQVERYPELVKEIAAAGHDLGLHGFRHQARRQWSRGLLVDDTRRALDAVSAAGGIEPILYRPPRGVFSRAGLRLIRDLGLRPLLWSKWGRDWERGATPETIADRATAGLEGGDVVLLHDADHYSAPGSWRATTAALGPIAERIATLGLPGGVRMIERLKGGRAWKR
jgi:peptidoglycan/xylan/chitin deacetylase (PgdA/CDA1 family)